MNTKYEEGLKDHAITFYRFRKDGTPNPDIKRAFLHPLNITAEDAINGTLTLTDDGSLWKLVLEEAVRDTLRKQATAYCICSFQLRRSGAYCVARLNRNEQAPNAQTTDTDTNIEKEKS